MMVPQEVFPSHSAAQQAASQIIKVNLRTDPHLLLDSIAGHRRASRMGSLVVAKFVNLLDEQ